MKTVPTFFLQIRCNRGNFAVPQPQELRRAQEKSNSVHCNTLQYQLFSSKNEVLNCTLYDKNYATQAHLIKNYATPAPTSVFYTGTGKQHLKKRFLINNSVLALARKIMRLSKTAHSDVIGRGCLHKEQCHIFPDL
jgi:hypothetical protein